MKITDKEKIMAEKMARYTVAINKVFNENTEKLDIGDSINDEFLSMLFAIKMIYNDVCMENKNLFEITYMLNRIAAYHYLNNRKEGEENDKKEND